MKHEFALAPAGLAPPMQPGDAPADLGAPIPLAWSAATPKARGPVVAGADPRRNALGVHAGAFAPYRAIAVATGRLDPRHRPDLADTRPAVPIGPFAQWSQPHRIVTLDPWGHRVASDFAGEIAAGLDIRPTIAVAAGELHMPEIRQAMAEGRLVADSDVLLPDGGIAVTKIAIEPVWWLPGLAARLGLDEMALRKALVRESGGQFPDLVAMPDLPVFLPPIGGTSVYLFGDPARLNRCVPVTCRIHDECNGSDVFGSNLCTCRPYLAFGVEECVRDAQAGGLGVVVYNRKEGRALGEVVKYLVYNARRQSLTGDRPDRYFDRTRAVAGTEDVREQRLMPDVLHWLGISRIDRWLSMSHLKRRALEEAGIAIAEQVAIPPRLVSLGATVEIAAKTAAGYFGGEEADRGSSSN